MNVFDFEQTGANNKKVRSRLTDSVGIAFAETFAAIVGANTVQRRPVHPFGQKNGVGGAKPIALAQKAQSQPELFTDAVEVDDAALDESLARIFSYENERVTLINRRLKFTGKLDNAIRVAILTLYAYEVAGLSEVERSWLNDVLNASKLEDGHFRTWIAGCDEIISSGSKVKLSLPGRDAAKEILKEVLDDSVVKGTVKFSKTSGRGRKSGKKNESAASETGGNGGSANAARGKGAVYHLTQLISEGYFDSPRRAGDIVSYLKDKKAEQYSQSQMSTPLKRMMKSNKLKRDKAADGHYEYSKA